MTLLEFCLMISAVLSIVFLLIVLIYYKFFKKYTREKFAFQVFLLILSLSSTFLIMVFSPQSSIGFAISLLGRLAGIDTQSYQPTVTDKLLGAFVIAALIYLAINLHRNWSGEISTREKEANLVGLKPELMRDVVASISDYYGKAPLQVHNAGRKVRSTSEYSASPTESKSWHQWAVRVLQISSAQLHIDELKDWYPDYDLYIGRYGSKRLPVVVLCLAAAPSESQIDLAIQFAKNQGVQPLSIVVAIDGAGSRENVRRGDHAIEFRYRDEMLDDLVDFGPYFDDIRFRYEGAEIAEGFKWKIPDLYVPSSGTVGQEEPQTLDSVEQFILDWLPDRSPKHLALLGEYGQAKVFSRSA